MLSKWEEDSEIPEALIRSSLGEAGELEAETKVIICHMLVSFLWYNVKLDGCWV